MCPLLENLGSSIVAEIGKGIFKSIPNAIKRRRVQRFFGKAVLGNNFYIVVDPFEHPLQRSAMAAPHNRYIKHFHGRKADIDIIGEDRVIGSCHLRTLNYAISFFAKLRNPTNPMKISSDEDVMNTWDGGFLCFGSADSNIKTFDIENLPVNDFYSLSQNADGSRCFDVRETIYNIENNEDVGLIIKLINPLHREHFLFICEGLGEWGTSGAVYYLFHNFTQIYKEANGKEFCKVIRTRVKADESAYEIRHLER